MKEPLGMPKAPFYICCEQRLLAKDNKRRLNRFVNSPAPNASKMRPKMLDIKLSFAGSGFDFLRSAYII